MNLIELRNLILRNQKRVLVSLVIGLGLIIGLSSINWWFTKANPVFGKIDKPKFINILASNPIWFITNLEVPNVKRAEVYKVVSREVSLEEAKALAIRLGLGDKFKEVKAPTGKVLWSFDSVNKNLVVVPKTGEISFKDSNKIKAIFDDPSIRKVDLEASKKKASAFLTSLNLKIAEKPISLELSRADYFNPTKNTLDISHSTSRAEDATVVALTYEKKLSGKSINVPGGVDEVKVVLTNTGEVAELFVRNLAVKSLNALYPLATEKKIRQDLLAGKGVFVSYDLTSVDNSGSIEANPQSVYLRKGKLLFYNDLETGFVQPIYEFAAVATKGNNYFNGFVGIPALESSYLK